MATPIRCGQHCVWLCVKYAKIVAMSVRHPSRLRATPIREFLFRETALDGASFARDFLPAFMIMAVALGLSAWLPVEADTGLRPVESSLLIIVGSLAAIYWIIARRLRRLKSRVLAISPEAIRVYPPRGLLALPGHQDPPELDIPWEEVTEVVSSALDSTAGKLIRRKAGMMLSRYEIRANDKTYVLDDLRWSPDIDTVTRIECQTESNANRRRLNRSLESALRLAGYPVRNRGGG